MPYLTDPIFSSTRVADVLEVLRREFDYLGENWNVLSTDAETPNDTFARFADTGALATIDVLHNGCMRLRFHNEITTAVHTTRLNRRDLLSLRSNACMNLEQVTRSIANPTYLALFEAFSAELRYQTELGWTLFQTRTYSRSPIVSAYADIGDGTMLVACIYLHQSIMRTYQHGIVQRGVALHTYPTVDIARNRELIRDVLRNSTLPQDRPRPNYFQTSDAPAPSLFPAGTAELGRSPETFLQRFSFDRPAARRPNWLPSNMYESAFLSTPELTLEHIDGLRNYLLGIDMAVGDDAVAPPQEVERTVPAIRVRKIV